MSDISEKQWKSALTAILEDLDNSQYRKLLECLPNLPKGKKTTSSKEKMPQKIIEHYGPEGSISAINDAMEEIPRKDSKVQDLLRPFVDQLRKKEEKESKSVYLVISNHWLKFIPILKSYYYCCCY